MAALVTFLSTNSVTISLACINSGRSGATRGLGSTLILGQTETRTYGRKKKKEFCGQASLLSKKRVDPHLPTFWSMMIFCRIGVILVYYIDTSVLLEYILVEFIKTTSGTRVVYFP